MKNKKLKLISILTIVAFVASIININLGLADDDEYEYREHKKSYEHESKDREEENREHDDEDEREHEDDDDEYEDDDDDYYDYYEEYVEYVEQEEIVYEEVIEEIVEDIVATETIVLKDSDGDGVLDEFDRYPGEDDFIYTIKDTNKNGIADDLEPLLL